MVKNRVAIFQQHILKIYCISCLKLIQWGRGEGGEKPTKNLLIQNSFIFEKQAVEYHRYNVVSEMWLILYLIHKVQNRLQIYKEDIDQNQPSSQQLLLSYGHTYNFRTNNPFLKNKYSVDPLNLQVTQSISNHNF